ncbi:hypothetical protein [Streptomyces sp. NPDC096153]|uniref:hypothetical protein n=1 Tax=Streptomyces sp. NPDC096153 TaxID=3155548 RepID=UPI003324588D
MAKSENTAHTRWASLLEPDAQTLEELRRAGNGATQLTQCGVRWDAVVIAPLERGLASLDALRLSRDAGYPVIADYARHELIVQVPAGTAFYDCASVQGVRTLTRGSWLLVPLGRFGADAAAWLSRPTPAGARYVDPARLREAVHTADEERGEHAHASC